MNITVEVKQVYGNALIYPICKKAQTFALIAGSKTLTHDTIKHVKALGYTIEVKQQSVKL